MTSFESAQAYFKTYDHWSDLGDWIGLFKVGPYHEISGLLKTPRTKIMERTPKVLGEDRSWQYEELLKLCDKFDKKIAQIYHSARQEMDRTHVVMLETCFPKDPKGHYTVYDQCSTRTISFYLEDCCYISGKVYQEDGGIVNGYFDFKSQDTSATHGRFHLTHDGTMSFTTEEDIY